MSADQTAGLPALLSVRNLAAFLGLSIHQTYRLVEHPPTGFPPPTARASDKHPYRFSRPLIEAWLEGADVSSGKLPKWQEQAASAPVKRGPGRPRKVTSGKAGSAA